MGKVVPWMVGAVVLASLAFVVSRSQQPPEAVVVTAERRDVVATLAVSGLLEAVEGVDLGAPSSGLRVESVLVDLGDTVQAGQVLVQLEAEDLDARISQARSRIAQAEAGEQLARVQAQGANASLSLAEEDLGSLTSLRTARDAASATRDQATQRVASARANLQRVREGGRADAVAQARAQLRRAEALAQQRTREAQRLASLFANGAVSRQELEQAQTAEAAATEDVQVARQAVSLAQQPRAEDITIASAELRQAESALAGAQQQLRLANEALQRRLAPRQSATTARSQRDAALASASVAQADRAAAEAALREVEVLRGRLTVRAPFAGRIAARYAEPGVITSQTQPLLRLSNDRQLRVRLDVDEVYLPELRVGGPALVSADAFPDRVVKAEISEIAPAANFGQGTLEVRLRLLEVPREFRPDLTVDANLETGRFPNAIVIPREAIKTIDGQSVVYTAPGGVVRAVPIKWKTGNLDQAVVTEGLEAGTPVLLDPRETKVGQRVRPVQAKDNAVRG